MIYQLLKRMIVTGNYEKDDMQNKLNVFFKYFSSKYEKKAVK